VLVSVAHNRWAACVRSCFSPLCLSHRRVWAVIGVCARARVLGELEVECGRERHGARYFSSIRSMRLDSARGV